MDSVVSGNENRVPALVAFRIEKGWTISQFAVEFNKKFRPRFSCVKEVVKYEGIRLWFVRLHRGAPRGTEPNAQNVVRLARFVGVKPMRIVGDFKRALKEGDKTWRH